MEAVLDSDLHLDRVIHLGRLVVVDDPDVHLLDAVREERPAHRHAQEIAQTHVDAVVRLILLLCGVELKREDGDRLWESPSRAEVELQRGEVVVVATIVEELDLADELDLDAGVLELLGGVFHLDGYLALDVLVACETVELFALSLLVVDSHLVTGVLVREVDRNVYWSRKKKCHCTL